MSEYQYYEFRTVDRPLTSAEISKLSDLSSRAQIAPTGFAIEYNYGDFRGDPKKLMEQSFDAYVNVTNWGTRHLMLRLPLRGIDLPTIESYANEALTFWVKGNVVILSYEIPDAEGDGDWEEGAEWMSVLLPLREELLNGDYRSLYLGWLRGVAYDEEYDLDDDAADDLEPPLPSGMQSLTDAQNALAEFLRLDEILIEAAALQSASLPQSASMQSQLIPWLKALPEDKKNSWLVELVGETGQSVRAEILLDYRESQLKASGKPVANDAPRRSIKELFAAREAHVEVYERRIAKEVAAEKAKAAKQAAQKRQKELDALSQRADATWKELEKRLSTTSTNRFINSVKELSDLRELAVREGDLEAFRKRLEGLLKRHSDKPTFLDRIKKASLRQ